MCAAAGGWWLMRPGTTKHDLTLYGNVDLRQVSLAFDDSGRIDTILVQEGDEVHKGQLVATMDTSLIAPLVAQSTAQLAAQQAVVDKLHHGTRPEEIAQARANLAAAIASAVNARRQYRRTTQLAAKASASPQDVDAAKAAMDVADAQVEVRRKALDLAIAGARAEDIAQAQALLEADKAQLTLLQRQLADTKLYAPVNSIVLSRLMEPGEMASPQRAVMSLAVTNPKWVRAYVSEPDLSRVKPGMKAEVRIDGYPRHAFAGWIGFISPMAEFTPKTIETPQLRTSLVYEIRVFVKDPNDILRLGMPATVILPAPEPAVDKTAGPVE